MPPVLNAPTDFSVESFAVQAVQPAAAGESPSPARALLIHPCYVKAPAAPDPEPLGSVARLTMHRIHRELWTRDHRGRAGCRSTKYNMRVRLSLDRLKEFTGTELYLAEVTPELIERFRKWRCDPNSPRHVAPRTALCDLRNVRAVWNYAQQVGLIRRRGFDACQGPSPMRLTLRRLFAELYIPARLARGSHAHREQMRLTIDRLNEFSGGELCIDEVSLALVDQFRAWRSDPKLKWFCSAATLNKDLRNLKALCNFAYRRDLLPKQIFIEMDPEPVQAPQAWFPEELGRLFQSAAKEPGLLPGTSIAAADFWQALFATVYSTGARIGAVMQIPRALVDLDRGLVTLRYQTQKQRRDQVLGIHPETIAAIRKIWEPDRELLFCWPFDKKSPSRPCMRKHYRRILERAGLPSDARRQFHCLRRTTATYLVAASDIGIAKSQLGHSAESVTRRYVDARQVNPRSTEKFIAPPPIANSCIGGKS